MRRRLRALTGAAALAVTTTLLVVLPTLPVPGSYGAVGVAPRPVPGAVTSFDVAGVDAAALGALAAPDGPRVQQHNRPAVLTAQRTTARFDLVALTWTGALPTGARLQVRVREAGRWSGWQELAPADNAPDPGPESGRTKASEPLVALGADGVQVRVDSTTGRVPSALRAMLVDGGRSPADGAGSGAGSPATPPASAAAAPLVSATGLGRPAIVTRAQWGADERLVTEQPVIDGRVTKLFVHHTVTTNSYTKAQSYAQMRAVYLFHVKGRGWNDIGYNFVVDRFGRVFEGRRGSITAAVHGAHTGGFNSDAIGIALLGTFSSARPTSAALRALRDVASWKSAEWFINPRGSTVAVSSGGAATRFASGKRVTLRTISGHRDVGYTECPGNVGYSYLPWLRSAVAARLAPGLSGASASASAVNWNGSSVTVGARPATNQRWWLIATSLCGTPRVVVASGRTAGRISARWELRGADGNPVPPGVYRLSLVSSSPVGSVHYDRDVEVLPTRLSPPSTCSVRRSAWGDVYTSAVMAGRERHPDARTAVLVGSGSVLNGLVAAPLAAAKNAPLLLTGSGSLPPVVRQDIASRGVRTVYVVGGTSTVRTTVVNQLRAAGVSSVVRLDGRDRYALAAAVARQVGAPDGAAVVVSGASPSDAAAVAGPAAAMRRPILLVSRSGVPAATGSALRALRVRTVLVVGHSSSVTSTAVAGLGAYGVTSRARVGAAERAATAVTVANAFRRPVPADQVVLAPTSTSAWSVIAAGQARLTVLTGATALPRVTTSWLGQRRPGAVLVMADNRAVASSVLRQAYAARR